MDTWKLGFLLLMVAVHQTVVENAARYQKAPLVQLNRFKTNQPTNILEAFQKPTSDETSADKEIASMYNNLKHMLKYNVSDNKSNIDLVRYIKRAINKLELCYSFLKERAAMVQRTHTVLSYIDTTLKKKSLSPGQREELMRYKSELLAVLKVGSVEVIREKIANVEDKLIKLLLQYIDDISATETTTVTPEYAGILHLVEKLVNLTQIFNDVKGTPIYKMLINDEHLDNEDDF